MTESLARASDKAGLSPGTLVHVGEPQAEKVTISLVDYDVDSYEELEVQSIDEIMPYLGLPSITWVNVDALHQVEVIRQIGERFDIHPLVLEDILNTHQRSKIEEYDDYLFIVMKAATFNEKTVRVEYEQISMILMKDFVFTFRERSDDMFDPLRRRISQSKNRFRRNGPDYLAYAILDTVIDRYFLFQDTLDIFSEELEEAVLTQPTTRTIETIQTLKREMIFLRRAVGPLREMVATLLRSDTDLVQESTRIYMRDVYDHVIRINEALESYRELITGMQEIYLSSLSMKMNEVMKVLTIFATLFIPLTFMVGIYGMNFHYMPELGWKWAYPAFWGAMLAVAASLLLFFRRKGWV